MEVSDLYESLKDDLHRFALSISRHEQEAYDLIQDAFLKAIGERELLVLPIYKQRAWFFRVMKNRMIDERRKEQKLIEWEEDLDFSVQEAAVSHLELTELLSVPRFENGKFTLTNSFLQSLEEPLYLVVNGVLTLPKDLNMNLFEEKIDKLRVNGKISLYEEQEAFLYKKAASLTTCKVEVIPTGFEVLNKTLRLNSRSIRRFRHKNLYTKQPIILEADLTREMLDEAVSKIHSTSVIVCDEKIEDLIYELLSLLETEVLSYEYSFILIEGEEVWSNDQFLALEKPANFIVIGKLTLDSDVTEEVLLNKVSGLDILGVVVVKEKKFKGSLQKSGGRECFMVMNIY